MEETFKNCIENYNYEVSNLGNVRRKLNTGEYKYINCSILKSGGGYKYFQVVRDKKRINYLIHHLVAKVFIGDRPDGLVIDHIDRNSLNNNINNLRYVTQKENVHNNSTFNNDVKEEGLDRHKIICKIYQDKNKDAIKIKKKEYCSTEEWKNHKKEYDSQRYQEIKEHKKRVSREWYQNNKEHRKEYMIHYNSKVKNI
jgi:hypothetical protein